VLGGDYQLALLGWGNRLGGRAESSVSLTSDFNKDKRITVICDQIYFAVSAAIVGGYYAIAAPTKFSSRCNLRASAYSRPGRRQFAILSATGANERLWQGHGPY